MRFLGTFLLDFKKSYRAVMKKCLAEKLLCLLEDIQNEVKLK